MEESVNSWFECKIQYERTMENGMVKKVVEPYIVEAINFSEAENRIIEEVSPFMSGEFEVKAVNKKHYAEVTPSTSEMDDKWYRVKIAVTTLNEVTGQEKVSHINYLVQAGDFFKAVENFNLNMKNTMMDYSIVLLQETQIMDVYKLNNK